jgi:putative tributyrin esterase
VTEVQVDDVLAWRRSFEKKGFAPHIILTKPATLSGLFAYFRDYGIINSNPAATKLVMRPGMPLQRPKGRAYSQRSSLSAFVIKNLCCVLPGIPLSRLKWRIVPATFLVYSDKNFGLPGKIKNMKNLILRFCLFSLLALSVAAQPPQTSSVKPVPVTAQDALKTFQLDSKLMARQMPYAVLLPAGYETDQQTRFPVVYLLHGLGGNYKNFIAKSKLLEYYGQHRFIIVAVEGGTNFYTDSATKPNDKYESYFISELIPEIDKNFRTDATRKGRVVAGHSMGGYGALKYGIKYPQMFALAASWSGGVNSASWRKASDLPPIPAIVQSLTGVFGDGTDPATLAANDLFKLFTELPPEKIAGLPFFYLDCGTEDELRLLKPNQQLAEIMVSRKIPHEYRQIPGGHALQDYRVEDVLNLSERLLATQKSASSGR